MSNPRRWLWLLCLVMTSSFFLAACGDDGNSATNDTSGGDTSSCSETECALQGRVCGPDGTCVVATEGSCAESGETCDPSQGQPDGFLCLENNDGTGVCLAECDGFFNHTCGADQKCFPGEFFSLETGFCDALGTGVEGQECSAFGSCGEGLLCLTVSEDAMGNPIGNCLKPDCTPLTTTMACGAGEECDGLQLNNGQSLDIGFCFTPCEAFASASDCAADEYCFPSSRNTSTGLLDGSCTEGNTGIGNEGSGCTSDNDCGNGLFCDGTNCISLCDPEADGGAQGACLTEGNDCRGLSSEVVYGVCNEACDYDDQTNNGCSGDQICAPGDLLQDDPDKDFCYPGDSFPDGVHMEPCPSGVEPGFFCGANAICLDSGGLQSNDPSSDDVCLNVCRFSAGQGGASDHPDCADGEYCRVVFSEQLEAGLCQPYDCDPAIAAGEMGGCPGMDDYCRPVSTTNTSIGRCFEACDFETGDTTCTDAAADCFPSYFLALYSQQGVEPPTSDICDTLRPSGVQTWPLNERADCIAAGYESFDPCSPTSVCLELDQLAPGTLCYDTCDLSKGMGEGNPDCETGRTCSMIFTGIDVGICSG